MTTTETETRRVPVLCGCGWGNLGMLESEVPENCPVCGSLLCQNPDADDECEERDDCEDDMDGDAESALASAGMGTDEDYGCYDDGDF